MNTPTDHHQPTAMPTATLEAPGGLADDVLQAARAVVQASPDHYARRAWAGAGAKNLPLLVLLDQLVGACEPVANAIADNAWDDTQPIPAAGAKRLAESLHRLADTITAAAAAPDASAWSLPSMTGKELV